MDTTIKLPEPIARQYEVLPGVVRTFYAHGIGNVDLNSITKETADILVVMGVLKKKDSKKTSE